MPLYVFRCEGCLEEKEQIQKYEDAPPTCEVCDQAMHRKLSTQSIQFKGEGWTNSKKN